MPLHPAWVKNISRRVLWAALERDITKADRAEMEAYFRSSCAYCGLDLGKRWHADHLLPVDQGGYNHVSNRVPSCAKCNEHEKRDAAWRDFLKTKCGSDGALFDERNSRILKWAECYKPTSSPVTAAQREAWKQEVDRLAVEIDASWNRLRVFKE